MPKTKKQIESIKKWRELRQKFDYPKSVHDLRPETHTTTRGVKIRIHGRGREVSKPVTAVKGIITKVYTPDSEHYADIPLKYERAKKLIEAGAPINEPRIKHIEDKKGERIVWKEADLGPSLRDLARKATPEEREMLMNKFDRATDKLLEASSKCGFYPAERSTDHAFLTKKGEVMFSDLWAYG